jgi:acyl carrier protein
MEKQKLIEKVNEVLAGEFEVEVSEITPDANIKKTLQLDSLSLVDMVALIEENFSVSIKGAEVANIQTFGSLYEFVFDRMQQKQ